MSSRVSQSLLAVIAILLAAHLFPRSGRLAGAEAAPVHDVVRARSIEILAPDGQIVAQIHTAADGAGQIRLRSGSGEVRVKLGASSDGSALVLLDGDTEPALWLATDRAGSRISLAQKGKETRVLAP